MKLNFLDRVKIAFSNNVLDDHVKRFLQGESFPNLSGGIRVGEQTALKYTAVFACQRVLAETYASVPLLEYKRVMSGDKKGDRERTSDTSIGDIMHFAPNPEMSAYNYHEMSMMQLNSNGNFYAKKIRNVFGEIIQLVPRLSANVKVKRDKETKKLIYDVRDPMNPSFSEQLTREEMFHIPGLSFDGLVGLSPIAYAAEAIKLGLMYEAFGVNYYKNGMSPTGVFEHPGKLNDESYKRTKEQLAEQYASFLNAGKGMLLEHGLTYKPTPISLIDAQLLESKYFQLEDIARIYRVPQHMINKLDRSTFSNIEHMSLEFAMYTMLPWFKRTESAANSQLLTREARQAGYFLEHNMAALLRGDQKTMALAFSKGRQWGYLSVNDIRRMLNLNSVEGGDEYLRPLNMVPVGEDVEDPDDAKEQIVNEVLQIIAQRG